MAYDPTDFVDVPEGQTPAPGTPDLDAAELNKIGEGIAAAHVGIAELDGRVTTLEGGTGDGGVSQQQLADAIGAHRLDPAAHSQYISQADGDNRWILQSNANAFAQASTTETALAGKQPLDADLTALAALDSATAGTVASDGAGWVKKTYSQLKTALGLTKGDVGLGNVDNTSDAAKPISTATQTALDGKVGTSDARLTDQRTPTDGSVTNAKVAAGAAISADKLADGTTNKVMTSAERTKLAGLASVATSGSYNDLADTPDTASSLADLDDVDTTGAVVGSVVAVADDDPLTFRLGAPPVVNVKDYGAKGDLSATFNDGATTSGVAQLSSPSAAFTSSDVGKLIDIYGSGGPATPPTLTATALSTGGALGPGTYSYRATVVTTSGESLPGPAVTVTIASGSTNSVDLTWVNPGGYGPDATIRVYGRTSGSEQLIASGLLSQPHYTADDFIDTGAVTPSGALPTTDASRQTLSTTITGVVNATTVTVAVAPQVTTTTARWQYGTNDGAAIAAAIAAAGDGTVYFPRGRYLVDQVLAPPAGARQTWQGHSRAGTILKVVEPGQASGTPTSLFDFSSKTSCAVRGMTLEGSRGWAPDTLSRVIRIRGGSTRVRISDIRINNMPARSHAVHIERSNKCVVEDFEVDSAGYGVTVASDVASGSDTSRNVIRRGWIENIDYNGIFLSGGFNRAANPGGAAGPVRRTQLHGLHLRSFWDTAIEIGEGSRWTVAADVTIDGQSGGRNGILLRDCQDTVLDSFSISDISPSADGKGIQALLYTTGGQVRTAITNGTITGCGRGLVATDTTDLNLTNVTASGNTSHGLHLARVSGFSLSGCLASNNGGHGILLGALDSSTEYARYGTVLGCRASDNGQADAAGVTYFGLVVGGTGSRFITLDRNLAYNTASGTSRRQDYGFAWDAGQGDNVSFGAGNRGDNHPGGTLYGKQLVGAYTAGALPADSYILTSSPAAATTSSTLGNEIQRWTPWVVPTYTNLTRIGVEVTTAGESGSKIRLGINLDSGGRPGDLLLDAGQVAGDAVGTPEATISQVLAPGLYWLSATIQAAATTPPTLRVVSNWAPPVPIAAPGVPASGSLRVGYQQTGVSGALPASPSSISSMSAAARIFVKTAA